jgi:hypothetical protein
MTESVVRQKFLVIWPGKLFPSSGLVDFFMNVAGCENRDTVHIPEAGDRPYFVPSTLIVTNVEANQSDVPGMMSLQAEIEYREGGIWDTDAYGCVPATFRDSIARQVYKSIPFDFLKDATIKPIRDVTDDAT